MNKLLQIDKGIIYYIFFLVPGVFLTVDLVFLGSGLWSESIGFSVRKLLFTSVCVYSFFYWLMLAESKLSEFFASFLLFIFILIWSFGVPLLNSGDVSNAVSDSQLFVGLLFAPAIYSVLALDNRWTVFNIWLYRIIVVLACIHIVIATVNLISSEYGAGLVMLLKRILEPLREDEDTSVFIGYVGDRFRVFWGSSIFLLVGFYLSIKNFRKEFLIRELISLFFIIGAIFLTITRGMVLSVPLFFIAVWFFRRMLRISGSLFIFYLPYGMLLVAMTIPIVLLSDPATLAYFGIGRDVSDDLRSEQIYSLLDLFFQHSLIGSGFGSSADVIRSESAPWSYEMSILALYMKIGISGTLFLLLTFTLFCYAAGSVVLNEKLNNELSRIGAFGIVVTFCGNTNPYLFSMLGVGLIMFFYFEFRQTLGQHINVSTNSLKLLKT